MRGCWAVVLVAGCSFNVIGTNVGGDPTGDPGSQPSPTQSVPDQPDAGVAATPPTTPPTPDMTQQRIGTACTTDAQCDSGLFCAQTFGTGLGKVSIPGGYCTLDCSKPPAACPANSFCQAFTFGKYCVSSCPPDPCGREGYQCCDYGMMKKGCSPDALCPKG